MGVMQSRESIFRIDLNPLLLWKKQSYIRDLILILMVSEFRGNVFVEFLE
jgi:hypothetical protein